MRYERRERSDGSALHFLLRDNASSLVFAEPPTRPDGPGEQIEVEFGEELDDVTDRALFLIPGVNDHLFSPANDR